MKGVLVTKPPTVRARVRRAVIGKMLVGIAAVLLQSVLAVLPAFMGTFGVHRSAFGVNPGTLNIELGTLNIELGTLNIELGTLLNAQDPMPRVDTLWTKKTLQTPWVDFQASAMGGNPRGLVVATVRREEPNHKFLVEYDIQTGEEIRNIRSGHYGDVQHMSFARNANVFTSAEAGLIKVWRWPEMELIREFRGPSGYRPAALLTSDGARLFDAKAGVMYDVLTGDTLWMRERSSNFAYPKMTPDDRFIVVYQPVDPGYATLIDAVTGLPLASFPGGQGRLITAMAVSDDGRYVAVSRIPETDDPGSLVVYDRGTETIVLNRTLGSLEGGTSLQFTPWNTGLLLGSSTFAPPPYWNWEYHPAWQAAPVHRFAWMGQYFSSDWTLNYGNTDGTLGVSRFNLETVAVEDVQSGASGTLYPNPSDGTITIRVSNAPDGAVRYEIVTTTGQMASAGFTALVQGQCRITPVPRLAAGTYVVRLTRGPQTLFSSSLIVR